MVEKKPASRLLKRPTRLGDEVYNAIYSQLMTQEIPPGGRIGVDTLVRELGVSQTPIREALSRLEAQGLVVKTHLIGYSAAGQMNREKLEQLYDMRMLLEPFAAGQTAIRRDKNLLKDLEDRDAEMNALPVADRTLAYGRFAQIDGTFHDLIALGSGNLLIQETLARLHTHVHLFRLHFHSRATTDANQEHSRILDAIRARDANAAESAMRTHIQESRARFLASFE